MNKYALVALAAALPGSALAIDHGNLDGERPLRVEDAYAVSAGEAALEAGVGFTRDRQGDEQGVFPLKLLYGALPNAQLEAGATLREPRLAGDAPRSADLRLGALYNLNQETSALPAVGLKAEGVLPTGGGSGADVEVKLLLTKSLVRLSLHLNAAHEFIARDLPGARDGRHRGALGLSYPLGAPLHTRTTVVAGGFADQSRLAGRKETAGVEFGLRRQVTQRVVWDAGLGRELSGPDGRLALTFTTGLSVSF